MSSEITFTIAEISKLNLEPGDVLNVKLIGDDFDESVSLSLQRQYAKIFPNNKVAIFTLPRGSDIQMEVVKTAKAPAPVKDCSVPTSYCNDCACGKKERIESGAEAAAAKIRNLSNDEFLAEIGAEQKNEYDIVDSVQETIDAINNGTYKPDQE